MEDENTPLLPGLPDFLVLYTILPQIGVYMPT
jgi:hypothetical protein